MDWRERNRDMKKGSQSRAEALPQLKEWTSKELDHLAREVTWKWPELERYSAWHTVKPSAMWESLQAFKAAAIFSQ